MKIKRIMETLTIICNKFKEVLLYKHSPYIVSGGAFVILVISSLFNLYNIGLIAITLLWIYNILYSCINIKKRYIFLLMNIMLFTFILDRPIISMFRGIDWWCFKDSTVWKALYAITISETFILFGNIIGEKITFKDKNTNEQAIEKTNIFKMVLLIVVIVTGIASAYIEIAKYIAMKDLEYLDNFTDKAVEFPLLLRTLSTIFSYSVFAYLATMPDKKKTIIVLGAYLLLGVPSLLLGSRNNLVLRILFAIVYIIIRNAQNQEKWITKKIKFAVIIMIPVAIIFLGAYDYIRTDTEIEKSGPIDLVIDFFYMQGTTFETVLQGFEYEDQLKDQTNVISYTFGDIIDYVLHNTISQKLFGTEDLGSGNNMAMVQKSNSMAHRLSYAFLGQNSYLAGHGRGTSYIIETYMDAGMFGIAMYSLVLGIYLAIIMKILKNQNFLINYMILTSLSQIFLLPRYSASSFISFIVTPHFWILVALIPAVKYFKKIEEKRGIQHG